MRKSNGARRSGACGVSPASGRITSSCPSIPTVGGVALDERIVRLTCPNDGSATPKHQTPNTKHQKNSKLQTPNRPSHFSEDWCLGFIWILVFGVWCFIPSPRSFPQTPATPQVAAQPRQEWPVNRQHEMINSAVLEFFVERFFVQPAIAPGGDERGARFGFLRAKHTAAQATPLRRVLQLHHHAIVFLREEFQ